MRQFLLLLTLFPLTIIAQQTTPAHQDFDFWLGQWDVYKTRTDELAGKSVIESINDGFAIRETYTATKGAYRGTSLNNFNKQSGKWEQYWTDNTGLVLYITGGLVDGSMVMDDILYHHDHTVHNRITWTPQKDGTVRQVWEQSFDEDFSWTVIFDGTYRRSE